MPILEFETSEGKIEEYKELMKKTGLTTMDNLIAKALEFLGQGVLYAEAGRSLISVPVGKERELVDAKSFDNEALRNAFTASLARR